MCVCLVCEKTEEKKQKRIEYVTRAMYFVNKKFTSNLKDVNCNLTEVNGV